MTTTHEPADTRSMGIVHSALRRDLERTRMVLSIEPYPDPERRRALAAHVVWMMHFLHIHHTGEDVGLWPMIRAKNPSVGTLLDQMDADHRRIAPAITALEGGRAGLPRRRSGKGTAARGAGRPRRRASSTSAA
jgi:hypothetical protein